MCTSVEPTYPALFYFVLLWPTDLALLVRATYLALLLGLHL